MPLHTPIPRHDPPSILDRARLHSSDLWLTVMAIDLGVIVTIAGSRVVSTLSPLVSFGMGATMLAGGALAACGLLWTGKTVSHGWTLEQTGWWLIGAAWAAYSTALVFVSPDSYVVYSLTIILSVAAFTRAVIVAGIEADGRATAKTKTDPGGVM